MVNRVTFRLEAIAPKNINYNKVFLEAYEKEIELSRNRVKRELDSATSTWNLKPKFNVRKTKRRGVVGLTITTNDERVLFVWKGTGLYGPKKQAYDIPKKSNKNAKTLRFQERYRAKTRPGRIPAGTGGSSGNFIMRKRVKHPGIKPRKTDVLIARREQKRLQSGMNRRFAIAARKANQQAARS